MCRAFRRMRRNEVPMLPHECRIAAAKVAGVPHLLAITEFWSAWEGGGSYDGIMLIRGMSEATIREVIAGAFHRIGVKRVGTPRTARLVAETAHPLRRENENAYQRRELVVSWGGSDELSIFTLDLSVTVVESPENRDDRWVLIPAASDRERAVVDEFRAAIRAELIWRCNEVHSASGTEVPELTCVQ